MPQTDTHIPRLCEGCYKFAVCNIRQTYNTPLFPSGVKHRVFFITCHTYHNLANILFYLGIANILFHLYLLGKFSETAVTHCRDQHSYIFPKTRIFLQTCFISNISLVNVVENLLHILSTKHSNFPKYFKITGSTLLF